MARKNISLFPNIHSYGQLLPADALSDIFNRDKSVAGMADADFDLVGERLHEAINRSWQKMLPIWLNFQELVKNLSASETGTSQTRKYFLLPLFQELGYGRLSAARAGEGEIRLMDDSLVSYPISHFRDESPIHLVGCKLSLDKKSAGVAGAAAQSPHSLVQEFLNRSDGHLWGIVSNGLVLRLLRDNASLSRQAYLEFNLQGIFESESFSEFALFWLCVHHSRLHTDNEPPEKCWLELWSRDAQNKAVTALDTLRNNVTAAIRIFGQGFIAANPSLRRKLADGSLHRQDYFRQLLRLAYRLIFLFVVEERDLLHPPSAGREERECYQQSWSLSRLRDLATRLKGARHHDLWEGVKFVMAALDRPGGCPELGLAPMGGFLWSTGAVPDLAALKLANADLQEAMRKLAFTDFEGQRRPVDWRNLGARELGSIYESLLELHPEISASKFELESAQGNERKTTGSYYTPEPLILSLLESALDPVINAAVKSDNPELALLNLKICDPACGSGHFLLAAASRLAKRLAALRSGDSEPPVSALREALRDVASRCIYGLDINPMSIELCKVGLWLETHEPGKPLSFLDHHLLCANSLMGATVAAIKEGIPASAYEALLGDDKKAVATLKKHNATQRKEDDQHRLGEFANEAQAVINAVKPLKLDHLPADTLDDMAAREKSWREWRESPQWQKMKFLYDLWVAAFVLRRHFPPKSDSKVFPDGSRLLSDQPFGIGWKTLVNFVNDQPLPPELVTAVNEAAREYRFFHSEVMFPEVTDQGGFDVVLGNPPWERIKLQEKEWFSANDQPDIAEARNAAQRSEKIRTLEKDNPHLFEKWQKALRQAEAFSHYLRNSGVYPLCGRGDINLYTVFAEWMREALNEKGRLGCIVPSGIATDDTTKFFFQDMVQTRSLLSLFDFENREKIFPAIDSRIKFSLLTSGSGARPLAESAKFLFFAHSASDLQDRDKNFTLTPAEINLLNPNTRTCPIFRSKKDAELTKAVYRRVPVLVREGDEKRPEENPWGIKFSTMFHMSNDSHLFKTRGQLESRGWTLSGNVFVKDDKKYLPLYEAKMIHHFNHRWASYGVFGENTRDVEQKELLDKDFSVQPRYWVAEEEVERQLNNLGWRHKWLLGWRGICRATDERTVVGGAFPLSAVGNSLPFWASASQECGFLPAILSSFACDFLARFKIGGTNFNFYLAQQIAVPPPDILDDPTPWQPCLTLSEWLRPRVLELTYTAEDMRPFAEDLGYAGEPFAWDEESRAAIRAELDAAFFHLYFPANPDGTWQKCASETEAEYQGLESQFPTPRQAVEYVMETFPITRKRDLEKFGEYRTRDLILENYDKLALPGTQGKSDSL